MSSLKPLPVHERFHAWQGEGVHMGRNAFFIRLFGCPLHCPWCDSAGTWHPDYVPKQIERVDPQVLSHEAKEANPDFVVITGGEPAIHDLSHLVGFLRIRGIDVHLETSGAYELSAKFEWLTVSPKDSRPALPEVMAHADEFKLIITHPDDIKKWLRVVNVVRTHRQHTWLHPEWSQRNNPDVLRAITEAVKNPTLNVRAGFQIHKLYKCDALDNRSAAPAPLGGNPANGM